MAATRATSGTTPAAALAALALQLAAAVLVGAPGGAAGAYLTAYPPGTDLGACQQPGGGAVTAVRREFNGTGGAAACLEFQAGGRTSGSLRVTCERETAGSAWELEVFLGAGLNNNCSAGGGESLVLRGRGERCVEASGGAGLNGLVFGVSCAAPAPAYRRPSDGGRYMAYLDVFASSGSCLGSVSVAGPKVGVGGDCIEIGTRAAARIVCGPGGSWVLGMYGGPDDCARRDGGAGERGGTGPLSAFAGTGGECTFLGSDLWAQVHCTNGSEELSGYALPADKDAESYALAVRSYAHDLWPEDGDDDDDDDDDDDEPCGASHLLRVDQTGQLRNGECFDWPTNDATPGSRPVAAVVYCDAPVTGSPWHVYTAQPGATCNGTLSSYRWELAHAGPGTSPNGSCLGYGAAVAGGAVLQVDCGAASGPPRAAGQSRDGAYTAAVAAAAATLALACGAGVAWHCRGKREHARLRRISSPQAGADGMFL